jgi:hypothetical protein
MMHALQVSGEFNEIDENPRPLALFNANAPNACESGL